MHRFLEDFLTSLGGTASPEDSWDITCRFFGAMGFTRVAYGFAGGADLETTIRLTNYPADYIEFYVERNHARDDWGLHHCGRSVKPLHIGISSIPEGAGKGALEVSGAAADAGLQTGLVLPLPRSGLRCRFAGMSIGNAMGRAEFDRMIGGEHELMIRFAALSAHVHLQNQFIEADAKGIDLSPRQRECLLWIARGLSRKAIAYKLGLNENTVDLHLRTAMAKLGAANGTHAAARAISLGLICP